jgi:hypothetical protein
MGEQYRQSIEEKISELGAENLSVFINRDGVSPHYRKHLEDTFREAGVRFVSTREEANLVFESHSAPTYRTGQVVAFFQESKLMFAGAL